MADDDIRLDPDATARLDAIMVAVREHGYGTTAGLVVSNAVRLYYAAARGLVEVTRHGETLDPAEPLPESEPIHPVH